MSHEGLFERAIEKLLADRSPRSEVRSLHDQEQRMVRMAQLLRGHRGQELAPAFVDRLHARLFLPRRIPRRVAFLSGLGALAASVVAGFALGRATKPPPAWKRPALVGATDRWYPVTTLAELPEGTIRPFTAGAIQGFLIHHDGQLRALSRICTHMGCTLTVNRVEQTFECPCHGAEFDLGGRLLYGPRKYGQPLPPLPPLMTRIRGETVEVLRV